MITYLEIVGESRSAWYGGGPKYDPIIKGNHIYCIDGWFDLITEVPATVQPFVIGLSRTKVPGKCQVHLRITFIPSPGTAQLQILGFKTCHVLAN